MKALSLQERIARGYSIHPHEWSAYQSLMRNGMVPLSPYVDGDKGGSFRQHYPSVAVMNQRSFVPVSGVGDAAADQAAYEATYQENRRIHLCGAQVYDGLSKLALLAAVVILTPLAFEKGRAYARGK